MRIISEILIYGTLILTFTVGIYGFIDVVPEFDGFPKIFIIFGFSLIIALTIYALLIKMGVLV